MTFCKSLAAAILQPFANAMGMGALKDSHLTQIAAQKQQTKSLPPLAPEFASVQAVSGVPKTLDMPLGERVHSL